MPLRIVRRLAELYPEESASRLKRAVLDGQVTVNGNVVHDAGLLVEEGDEVAFDVGRRLDRHVATGLTVLYEDDDVIAVVKPAGVLTHPTESKEKDTLVSRVSGYVARRRKGRGYVAVVHRLDKGTSGILAFAKSRAGLVTLQTQLRAHTMDRRYQALVEGHIPKDRGVFDQDLVADRGDRRRGVAKEGEEGLTAVTEWRVLERFGIATLVEARLKTGRTHQVRVHFSGAGLPLVGDPVYRDPRRPPFPLPFPRQALHAGHLGFRTPGGGEVSLDAPLPADMEKLLAALRARYPAPPVSTGGAGREPVATRSKPVATRPKPVATRPKPATAGRKPATPGRR